MEKKEKEMLGVRETEIEVVEKWDIQNERMVKKKMQDKGEMHKNKLN